MNIQRKIRTAIRFLVLVATKRFSLNGTRYNLHRRDCRRMARSIAATRREADLDQAIAAAFELSGGAFIDVGANIGQTLLKVLSIDENRRYIGFEPQPNAYSIVQRFISLNKLSNHTIVGVGLGERTEIMQFHYTSDADQTASMANDHRPSGFHQHQMLLPVFSGESALEQFEIVDISVVKIDVEGAEIMVLEGLRQQLIAHKPLVVFEVLSNYLAMANGAEIDAKTKQARERSYSKIEQLFEDIGYVILDSSANEVSAIAPLPSQKTAKNLLACYSGSVEQFRNNYRSKHYEQ